MEEEEKEKDHELELTEKALIKSKGCQYMAPINKNHALELFLQKLEVGIQEAKEKSGSGDNLTPAERKALNEMKRWKDAIIRPFDKGVGFVVDDLSSYK